MAQHPGPGRQVPCKKCGKDITGKWLETDGAFFHPECFTCDNCRALLPGTFNHHDGKRLCDRCVPQRTCTKCGREIAGQGVQTEDGGYFHSQCLLCDGCSAVLSGPFHHYEGKRLCDRCVPKNKCRRCGQIITGESVNTDDGAFYHQECFKCNCCSKPLTGKFFKGPPGSGQVFCSTACQSKGPQPGHQAGGVSPSRGAQPDGGAPGRAPAAVPTQANAACGGASPGGYGGSPKAGPLAEEKPKGVSFSQAALEQEVASPTGGEARRIFNLIDIDSSGTFSKLKLAKAVETHSDVNKYVLPDVDGNRVFTDEVVFDTVCEMFQKIGEGSSRVTYKEFSTFFGEAAVRKRKKTLVIEGMRARLRVFIIGPGFGREINPRQARLVETAGFQIHYCVGNPRLPNPETPGFPTQQYMGQIKAELDQFKPQVVVGASKGASYVTGMWAAGIWRGPTLMINAHPTLGSRLPPDVPLVICHGVNDEVYHRPREVLEELIQTGSPNKCLLYYTGNSGQMPDGRFTRVGDMHNMESLLHYSCLPRLIDATVNKNGPEIALLESWRQQLIDQRVTAESWLGLTPELLKRFWVSGGRETTGRVFPVDRDNPATAAEYEQVVNLFTSLPREPPMYCGSDSELWPRTNILKVERVENATQMDGNAKPNCETLRRSIEEQGLTWEPGLHTRWAFHGTDAIDSVISNPMQGFQPLASGSRGASVWGSGTYFARDPKYVCDGGFCPRLPNGSMQCLVCLLMTGMPTLGDPNHKGVLPIRQKPHRYNAAVDSLSSPEIFVIGHPGQAYPAYLITFMPNR